MNHHQQLLKEIAGTDNLTYSKKIACAIGMGKAVIFGRIAFWAAHNSMESNKKSTHFHFDMWWMYNSIRKWVLDIEHLAKSTIEVYLGELLDLRLIHSGKFNKTINTTLWYTVNDKAFEHFMALWEQHGRPRCGNGTGQTKKYQAFIDDWKTNHAPHYALVVYTHEHKVSCITGQQNDEGVLYNRTGGVLPDRTTIPVPQSVPQKISGEISHEIYTTDFGSEDEGWETKNHHPDVGKNTNNVVENSNAEDSTNGIGQSSTTKLLSPAEFAKRTEKRQKRTAQNGSAPDAMNIMARNQGNRVNVTDLPANHVARVVIGAVETHSHRSVKAISVAQCQILSEPLFIKDGQRMESPQWYYEQYPKQFRTFVEEHVIEGVRSMKKPVALKSFIDIITHPEWYHGWLRYANEHGLTQGLPQVVDHDTGESVEETEHRTKLDSEKAFYDEYL